MNVLVIGASRGIGFGFTEQYLKAGCSVIATYRNKKTCQHLTDLEKRYPNNLVLRELEITTASSVTSFAKTIKKIDLLILNAGIKGYPVANTKPPGNTLQELENTLNVNTKAHDHIIRELYPKLSQTENACIVYMSSRVGLTSDNESGGYHPYRISKAASNAMIWNWNISLMEDWKNTHPNERSQSPCAVAICPGWVRTDMGGSNARLSVEESVSQMVKVIEYVVETKQSNGLYMYDGTMAEKYTTPAVLKEIVEAKYQKKHPVLHYVKMWLGNKVPFFKRFL